MSLVVTGATGQLGRLVIESLLGRGVAPEQIVAGGRDESRMGELAERGVRTATIDYDRPETLDAAFAAGDTLLLISASVPGIRVPLHRNVIDAAVRAGVARIVYTSAPHADTSALVLAPEHKATEELIAASGLPATILRNGWYTENYLQQVRDAAESGLITASVGAGRVASATRADYADAAAVALIGTGHDNVVYELTGDVAWSFDDLAAAASKLLGRPVRYESLTPDEHRARLIAGGVDAGTADFVVALDGNIRDGALGETGGELARLIGRPTTPLLDGLRAAL